MALDAINPTQTLAWNELREHFNQICYTPMQELFAADANRANRFHIEWEEFLLDYSKNKISLKTIDLFLQLAQEVGLKNGIEALFSGKKINKTENRAVLHTALRADSFQKILVDDVDVIPEVNQVKSKIKSFSEAIISGAQKGYTGKAFTDIVNIGIGGSDLVKELVSDYL